MAEATGWDYAKKLRNFAEVLAPVTRPQMSLASDPNGYNPPPEVDMTPGRTSTGELYDKLMELQGRDLDYSKLKDIVAAQQRQARRDYMGGMGLVMFGDKGMRQAGQHVLEKALEAGKTLRPNAADTAYVDPESGEIIQSPQSEIQNKRQILEYALGKQQARDLALQQQAEKARQAEYQRQLAAALAASRNNTQVIITQMRDDTKAATSGKGAGTKPLTHTEVKDLTDLSSNYQNLRRLGSEFKDDYSKAIGDRAGLETQNWVTNNFPSVRNAMVGPATQAQLNDQARWWREQQFFDVLPIRHEMFGSALTAPEKASWEAASIHPGMEAAEIRRNLAKRADIMEKVAARLHSTQVENGKHAGAVRAGLGGFSNRTLGIDQELPATGFAPGARTPQGQPIAPRKPQFSIEPA